MFTLLLASLIKLYQHTCIQNSHTWYIYAHGNCQHTWTKTKVGRRCSKPSRRSTTKQFWHLLHKYSFCFGIPDECSCFTTRAGLWLTATLDTLRPRAMGAERSGKARRLALDVQVYLQQAGFTGWQLQHPDCVVSKDHTFNTGLNFLSTVLLLFLFFFFILLSLFFLSKSNREIIIIIIATDLFPPSWLVI